jgi:hypothetical protein
MITTGRPGHNRLLRLLLHLRLHLRLHPLRLLHLLLLLPQSTTNLNKRA